MLSEMITEDRIEWFAHPEMDEAEFHVKFIEAATYEGLRKKCLLDKRNPYGEIDELKFSKLLVKEVLIDWKNFKIKDLPVINFPTKLESKEKEETEIPYSTKDALAIAAKCPKFNIWLQATVLNFQGFADKERESWGKKSSTTPKTNTKA